MADFPTLAEVVAKHADSWHGEKRYPVQGITQPGFRSCTCGQWMDDDPAAQFSRASFGTHLQAAWVKARTIETPGQLDALPLMSVVKEIHVMPSGHDYGAVWERWNGSTVQWMKLGLPPERSFPSTAIQLPALLLWHPERDQ